jgi:hypothetical protein
VIAEALQTVEIRLPVEIAQAGGTFLESNAVQLAKRLTALERQAPAGLFIALVAQQDPLRQGFAADAIHHIPAPSPSGWPASACATTCGTGRPARNCETEQAGLRRQRDSLPQAPVTRRPAAMKPRRRIRSRRCGPLTQSKRPRFPCSHHR